MANYVVLTEQEAQEAVKNICDWVEVQCCNLLDSTATPTEYATAFGYFTVALNEGGVRVANFRPDLKTVVLPMLVQRFPELTTAVSCSTLKSW